MFYEMSLNTVCRLCLCKIPTNVPSLINNSDKMLKALTSISVQPTNEPLRICLKCNLKLKLAYNIQQDIIKANEKLRNGYLNAFLMEQQSGFIETEENARNSNLNSVKLPTTCIICNSVPDENSIKLHLQQHFDDLQHCDLCNQIFSNIRSYQQHLVEHPKYKKYKCTKCEITFRYKSLYNVHMEKVHPDSSSSCKQSKLKDNISTSSSEKINEFQQLEFVHSIKQETTQTDQKMNGGYLDAFMTEQPYDLIKVEEDSLQIDNANITTDNSSCMTYNSVFNIKSMTSRLRQLLNDPQHEQLFKCDKCETTFRYESLYYVHKIKAHPSVPKNSDAVEAGDTLSSKNTKPKSAQKTASPSKVKKIMKQKGPHTCNICVKQITNRNDFNKHIENHKSGPQVCEHCGHTYANIRSLRGHMDYKHRKGGVYECTKCKITFESGYKLKQHRQREHQGLSKVCETCGKKFAFSRQLQQHKAVHTKEARYVCEICKRGFRRRYTLDTHRRQHTNETPYKCEVCGDGFKHNVSLKTHRKSKHGIVEEVTSSCEMCGKGFPSEHALNTHMKKKH